MAKKLNCVTSAAAAIMFATGAGAAVTVSLLGSAAPPATLGGLAMTPAPPDPAPLFPNVTSAPLATDLSVLFSIPMSHRRIQQGWGTWSHGYLGDVYYSNGAQTITMTFSQPDVDAFYFYVESGAFQPFTANLSVNGSQGRTVTATQMGHGMAGAVGYGIVATGGSKIVSITVSFPVHDFSVGEFAWHRTVPAPGALALCGVVGVCAGRRRRR